MFFTRRYPSFWGRAELKLRSLLPQEPPRFVLPHPLQPPVSTSGQSVSVLPMLPPCPNPLPVWGCLLPGTGSPTHTSLHLFSPKYHWQECAPSQELTVPRPTSPPWHSPLTRAPLVPTARSPAKGSLSANSSLEQGEPSAGSLLGRPEQPFAHRLPRQTPALLSPLPPPEEEGRQPMPWAPWDNSEHAETDFEGHGAPLPPYSESLARLMSLVLLCRSHPHLKQVRSEVVFSSQPCLTEEPNLTVNSASSIWLCGNKFRLYLHQAES